MKEKKLILRIVLLVLSLLFITCSVYVYYYYQVISRGGNLKGLSTALFCYANENDDCLPDADRWTDQLIEQGFLDPSFLEDGQTRYAMNIHVSGLNLTQVCNDNIVLLFEAKGPKNLCGGPELIHSQKKRWPGCAVQYGFVEDQIKFFKKDGIDTLQWKP